MHIFLAVYTLILAKFARRRLQCIGECLLHRDADRTAARKRLKKQNVSIRGNKIGCAASSQARRVCGPYLFAFEDLEESTSEEDEQEEEEEKEVEEDVNIKGEKKDHVDDDRVQDRNGGGVLKSSKIKDPCEENDKIDSASFTSGDRGDHLAYQKEKLSHENRQEDEENVISHTSVVEEASTSGDVDKIDVRRITLDKDNEEKSDYLSFRRSMSGEKGENKMNRPVQGSNIPTREAERSSQSERERERESEREERNGGIEDGEEEEEEEEIDFAGSNHLEVRIENDEDVIMSFMQRSNSEKMKKMTAEAESSVHELRMSVPSNGLLERRLREEKERVRSSVEERMREKEQSDTDAGESKGFSRSRLLMGLDSLKDNLFGDQSSVKASEGKSREGDAKKSVNRDDQAMFRKNVNDVDAAEKHNGKGRGEGARAGKRGGDHEDIDTSEEQPRRTASTIPSTHERYGRGSFTSQANRGGRTGGALPRAGLVSSKAGKLSCSFERD